MSPTGAHLVPTQSTPVDAPVHLRTREMVFHLDAIGLGARGDTPLLQTFSRLRGPQVRRLLTDKLATTKTRKLMPAIAHDLRKDYALSSTFKTARKQSERQAGVDVYEGVTTFLRGVELKEAAELMLAAAMQRRREFDGFDVSEAWRLFIDAEDQTKNGDYRYENESGYMGGVMSGFTTMLGKLDKPLDVDMLIELHDSCVDNVLRAGSSIQAAEAMRSSGVINSSSDCYIGKDMRSGGNNKFGIIFGRNGTSEGLEELRRLGDSGHIEVRENVDGYDHIVRTAPLTNNECRRVAGGIIEAYHAEVSSARSPDDKLIAIARCCRNLEAHHLFMDGNARTIGFVLLNKLLIENRLPPAAM